MTSLWSMRWSIGRGWTWVRERTCTVDNASDWLIAYTKDEPTVTFRIAKNKPRN